MTHQTLSLEKYRKLFPATLTSTGLVYFPLHVYITERENVTLRLSIHREN